MSSTSWLRLSCRVSVVLFLSVIQAQVATGEIGVDAIAVGATVASFEVDQQGGATYRIPLFTVPSPGGLQPSIALIYNSHTGNGPLGVGWAIEGLSAIHRCFAIHPLHGYRGRVNMDGEDLLCIDGRFLAPVDGSATSLESRELRTHIESFAKITTTDGAGFTVQMKEGQVITYGDSANARIRSQDGGIFSWLMSRVIDRVGNAVNIRYAKFGNERHVERIDYGFATMLFEYEPKLGQSVSYLAGMEFPLTQRLNRIVVYVDNRLIREYRFNYEDSDDASLDLLTSVTECSGSSGCFRPTTFKWQSSSSFELSQSGKVVHSSDQSGEYRRYWLGDFNGDGLTDIYETHGTGGGYDTIQLNMGDGSFESVSGPWTEINTAADLLNFHFADFNGDGLTDIYQFRYRHSYDRLYLTRLSQAFLLFDEVEGIGSGVASVPSIATNCVHRNCLRFGDFNGDGNTDVYRIRHRGRIALDDEIYLSNGDGTYERIVGINSAADKNEERAQTQVARIRLGDFNGDGVADIYRVYDSAVGQGTADDIYLTLGSGEYERIDGIKAHFNSRRDAYVALFRLKFGDFNSDGLVDIYHTQPSEIYLSRGNGDYTTIKAPMFSEISGREGLQLSLSRIRLGDFNGDGRTDIYYMTGGFRPDDVYLKTSNGWHLREGMTVDLEGSYANQIKNIERVSFHDFNGDGVTDVYHIEDLHKKLGRVYITHSRVNLIHSFTNGLGSGLRVQYTPLAGSSVHELSEDTMPMAVRRPPPLWVVADVETSSDNLGRTRLVRHRYGGARSDLSGFGFLGFAWKETHDVDKQLIFRMAYSQEFPYFGSVLKQETLLVEGQLLSSLHTEYGTLHLNDRNTVFPHPVRSKSRHYDTDGSFVSMIDTSFSDYDEYGNVGVVEKITEDEVQRFSHIEHHDYFNDREHWILGKRIRLHTIDSNDSHADITRVSVFEYDLETGFLLSETVEADNPLAITLSYEYDGFGNLVVERVKSIDMSAPLTVVSRIYDETGRFEVKTVNAENHITMRVYDEGSGQATLIVNANGLAIWRKYDAWGKLVSERHPNGVQTTIVRTYNLPEDVPKGSVYAVIEEITGRPRRRAFHDLQGRVLSVRTVGFDGSELIENREYDRYGRMVRLSLPHHADELADWVERRYDRLDRLLEERSPLIDQAMTERKFNYRGLIVENTDELGRLKVVTRDALGRIVRVVEPAGAEMSFEYDPLGRITKAIDAHGNEVVMKYDVFGNRVSVTHPDQGVQRFKYDLFGRVISVINAAGKEQQMKYDRLGRLIERVGPEGTARWSYDVAEYGVGRLASETYEGYKRSFHYNSAGELSQIEDHRGYITEMIYDAGRLREIHYPRGFVVNYFYNNHGYLSAVGSPFSKTIDSAEGFYQSKIREYKNLAIFYEHWASRLESSYNSKEFIERLNVVANKLKRGVEQLRQNVLSNEAFPTVADCEFRTSDKPARVKRFLKDAKEANASLKLHVFSGADIERQMYARIALSNRLLDEMHDCLSLMSQPTEDYDANKNYVYHWLALEQDAVGRVISERTGDGWQTKLRYHTGNGYLQEIRSDFGDRHDVRHFTYHYDEADNLLSRTDHAQQISEYFDYDDLDRIIANVVLSDHDHDDYNKVSLYRYDELGNLIFRSDVGNYDYGAGGKLSHAAVKVGEDDYEYDASGNLVSSSDLNAKWSSFGKAIFLEATDGGRVDFEYDANGNRISKHSSNGNVTLYVNKFYEKNIKANGEIDNLYYIYAGNRLVAICYDEEKNGRVTRKLRYLHHDALGSVDTITDKSGAIVDRLSYTPFGDRRASDWRGFQSHLSTSINRGFTGHEHLDEVGLVHMNGRIYDPRVGRFLSPDPYVPSPLSTQSYNRYSYALNNPMKFTDPSGFFLKKIFKGVKRAVKKVSSSIRSNARLIAAVTAGYYAGAWASNTFIKSAVSKLAWSPGGMWNGAYMSAYNSAVAGGSIVGGVVSGSISSALSGGNFRSVLAGAVGGGALRGIGVNAGGRWTPRRVLLSATVNGTAAAVSGGSFRRVALSSLRWGGLRYAATVMRRAMVAQSLLNPKNAGGLSAGFFGDNFKLGGGRYDTHGSSVNLFGGNQNGSGKILGVSYGPDSLWDNVVEAYAGPHDYLNSFYWYDDFGNVKSHLNLFQRQVGEVLSGANLLVATPFAAASLAPDYIGTLSP